MKADTSRQTNKIIKASGIKDYKDILELKDNKKAMKKLKKMLKELELLRRMGGITVVVAGDSIITTYHNNSLKRKHILNKNKIKY